MAKDENARFKEPERDDRRRVRRRRVIYAHGFDPARSERYRRLIQRAGEEHAGVKTVTGAVGPITEHSEGWRIDTRRGDETVETVFEILRYEDVVKHWRGRNVFARLATGIPAWCRFAFLGGLRRTFMLAKGPVALFFYPMSMLTIFIVTFLIFGGLAGRALEVWLGAPEWTSQAGRLFGAALGLFLSLRAERALFVHLMLALFDFLIRVAEDKAPAGRLDARIDAFAERILQSVTDAERAKVDEIVIVGHSLGGLVAVRALAAALERDIDLTGGRATVSLLTLGSVAGFLACRGGPGAVAFGEDVKRIATAEDIAWVDVSAPRDWFSFGLVDPLLMVEDPPRDARSPLVISAKFGKFKPDPDDKRTKFRAMGLHMRYLGAPDRPGGFDFFDCVTGSATLSDRFAERRNSPRAKMLSH